MGHLGSYADYIYSKSKFAFYIWGIDKERSFLVRKMGGAFSFEVTRQFCFLTGCCKPNFEATWGCEWNTERWLENEYSS